MLPQPDSNPDAVPPASAARSSLAPASIASRQEEPIDPTRATGSWTFRRKLLASGLLLLHLFAVFAAPCASPPPASYSWNWLAGRVDGQDGLLMPYLRAMYLNHGYRFFAPNPGASHLVRYEIETRSGDSVTGRFPDPDQHWPRLLYHRFFMISESLSGLAEPVSEPPSAARPFPPLLQIDTPSDLPETEQQEFQKQKAAALELAESISRRLLQDHDGVAIRLYLQTHDIPMPDDVLNGKPLDAPEFYSERLVGEFGANDQ